MSKRKWTLQEQIHKLGRRVALLEQTRKPKIAYAEYPVDRRRRDTGERRRKSDVSEPRDWRNSLHGGLQNAYKPLPEYDWRRQLDENARQARLLRTPKSVKWHKDGSYSPARPFVWWNPLSW
jgi:hypothetical protein